MRGLPWWLCPSLYDPCCGEHPRVDDLGRRRVGVYCDSCGDALEGIFRKVLFDWNRKKRK